MVGAKGWGPARYSICAGSHVTSGGQSGEKPDYPPVVELLALYDAWMTSETAAEREAAWMDILRIHGEEVLTLGTVQGVVQPVVISNDLKNVPMKMSETEYTHFEKKKDRCLNQKCNIL